MVAVANTSSSGLRNVLRKTHKFSNLLASFINFRHGIIRSPSSPLTNDKGNIDRRTSWTEKTCAQNYSPCSCYENKFNIGEPVDGNNEIYVTCDGVQNVFQRVNNPEIDILRFKIPPDDATNTISLPADFLGNMSVTSLIQFTTYWLYWPLCLQFQIPEFGDRPYGFPIIAE